MFKDNLSLFANRNKKIFEKRTDQSTGRILTRHYITTNQQAGFLPDIISQPISRPDSYPTLYHNQSAGRVLSLEFTLF